MPPSIRLLRQHGADVTVTGADRLLAACQDADRAKVERLLAACQDADRAKVERLLAADPALRSHPPHAAGRAMIHAAESGNTSGRRACCSTSASPLTPAVTTEVRPWRTASPCRTRSRRSCPCNPPVPRARTGPPRCRRRSGPSWRWRHGRSFRQAHDLAAPEEQVGRHGQIALRRQPVGLIAQIVTHPQDIGDDHHARPRTRAVGHGEIRRHVTRDRDLHLGHDRTSAHWAPCSGESSRTGQG